MPAVSARLYGGYHAVRVAFGFLCGVFEVCCVCMSVSAYLIYPVLCLLLNTRPRDDDKTGGIPTALSKLTGLQELHLYNNQLTGETREGW